MHVLCVKKKKKLWKEFTVTERRWVNSQYLPVEWIIYCIKPGTGEEEFASHFFTGSQNTLTQWEWWSTYFCFSWLKEIQARGRMREITRTSSNRDKQHWNWNPLCIISCTGLCSNEIHLLWLRFLTFTPPLASLRKKLQYITASHHLSIWVNVWHDISDRGLWWTSCKDVDKGPDEH